MQQKWRRPIAGTLVFALLVAPGLVAGGWFVSNFTFVGFSDKPQNAELVVLDAPDGFEILAHRLGYELAEKNILQELGMTALRLKAPHGMSAENAKKVLSSSFPKLVIELNLDSGAYKTSSDKFIDRNKTDF
jgi:hypothetical protein